MWDMSEVLEWTTEGSFDLETTLHVTTSAPLEICTECLPLNAVSMNLEFAEMVVTADQPSVMDTSLLF